jgi:hypothetical protein
MVEARWCGVHLLRHRSSGLSGVMLQSLCDRRALMDSRRADTLSGVVAVSMYGPVRGFASVYHSEDGWRDVAEVTSEKCAQDTIFEL